MRQLRSILTLLLLLAVCPLWAQTLSLQVSPLDAKIVRLDWEAEGPLSSDIHLYRSLPDEDWMLIRTFPSTFFSACDTVPRMLCGDSVRYRLSTNEVLSNVVAVPLSDNLPTSDCQSFLVTVDDTSQLLTLSWSLNPDPDIMGYYLCSGFPCTDFDTVWGPLSHTYTCTSLSPLETHTFRLLAFDSCSQAGPLTETVGNMVLHIAVDTAIRQLTATWTPYIGMPGGISRQALLVRYGSSSWDTIGLDPSQVYYSFTVSDRHALSLFTKVMAFGSDGLVSSSNIVESSLPAIDDPEGPIPPSDTTQVDTLLAFFPNAFTPDLPTNSIFLPIIQQLDPSNYQLFIYNRHGTLVFQTRDASLGWDGRSPQGQACPQGVYAYTLRARRFVGGVHTYTGTVLLLR